MRCKKTMALFRPQCEVDQSRLETMVTVEPSKLLHSNDELLRTCKLFQEGGDYDQKEIDLLRLKLEKPSKAIEASVAKRKDKIREVKEAQDRAWSKIKVFKAKYDACVLDLCLREGLGQKYGAPRRAAQEKCRTELCRDEKNAQQLNDLLTSLENLCRRAATEAQEPIYAFDGSAGQKLAGRRLSMAKRQEAALAQAEPLAVTIRKTLTAIRKCTYKRGMYLEYLKAPSSLNAEMALPLDLEEGDGPAARSWPEVEVPDITVGTFAKAVQVMEEECKIATRKLYESDGKQAALGPEGIPESLKAWLEDRKEKILGEGGNKHNSIAVFTEHVNKLQQLLGDRSKDLVPAPAAYLEDITKRAMRMGLRKREYRIAMFSHQLRALEEEKEKHRTTLR